MSECSSSCWKCGVERQHFIQETHLRAHTTYLSSLVEDVQCNQFIASVHLALIAQHNLAPPAWWVELQSLHEGILSLLQRLIIEKNEKQRRWYQV